MSMQRITLGDGKHIRFDRIERLVANASQIVANIVLAALDPFDQKRRLASKQGLARASQHIHFHAFDVDLQKIDAFELQGVDTDHRHRRACGGIVRDSLADELGVLARPDFQTAEARRREVIRLRNADLAHGLTQCSQPGPRIEAVVEREIAGQRVVDDLLRLETQHASPTVHVTRPFHGMHADIRAAVYGEYAVTEITTTQREKREHELHFLRIKAGLAEDLMPDAVGVVRYGVLHGVEVVAIDDQRAMV